MNARKSTVITILVLLLILCIAGYVAFQSIVKNNPEKITSFEKLQADGAEYTDLQNNPVSLDDYAGKFLVINAWASWSPFSMQELSDLSKLKSEFGDQIEVIAINRKEPSLTARSFIDQIGNTEGVIFLLDISDFFFKSIEGYAMPETVMYDESGNITLHKRGPMKIEEMRTHVQKTLNSEKE